MVTPRFKIGDAVKTNEFHRIQGKIYFKKNLKRITKRAIIKNIIIDESLENPIIYETNDKTVDLINEIFLEKAI
jgi:hypothetical protein